MPVAKNLIPDSRAFAVLAIPVVFLLVLFVLPVETSADGVNVGSGGVNSPNQRDKPYLLLISIDGFGWDARARTETPALDRLAENGIVATSMRPVFPTLTFPNHYSIATGLYPSEHGIVGNKFPNRERNGWYKLHDRTAVQDGSWYSGAPIWVQAEKNGMVAAAYYFVGTEAAIGEVRPTYFYLFDRDVPGIERVDQVLEWLRLPDERRPHMLTLYFEDVDLASHANGPDAPQTIAAIRRVDSYMGRLLQGIEMLPIAEDVYVLVVSDHGQMTYADMDTAFVLEDHVDIGDAEVIEGGNYVMLYFDDPDDPRIAGIVDTVNANWQNGRAYTRQSAPQSWQVTDDRRYPEILIQPDGNHAVVTRRDRLGWLTAGAHGWRPREQGMRASFIAMGPGLPQGQAIGEIRAVDIYPLMLEILGLAPPPGYVAEPSALTGILRAEQRLAPPGTDVADVE